MMDSRILSRADLDFLLYEWLDVPALTTRPRFEGHSRETFDAALATLEATTTLLRALRHPQEMLANASAYLEAMGHIVVAWIWLDQMIAASSDTNLHRGKRQAGRYFFHWELPKVANPLARIAALDDIALAMADN